ncbi:MAG: cation transporter [Burkholderiales bacterium]|nr:cation diffusion facilitator family transporter [Burkholderiales bacterium]MDE2288641.1 cation transporter [Burkholderiales bacterium]
MTYSDKQAVASRITWVSIWVNIGLTLLQLVVGTLARSQALIADGVHSLSDLVSDGVVLAANHGSGRGPDDEHPYGHNRYENVASLFLGVILLVVGAGMLWRGGERLLDTSQIPAVHVSALIVAAAVLVAKETLFRYMLREAQRVRSAMLVANAWHARSDAASSLVVAIGIAGNLAGWRMLDPIAAGVVGIIVGHMGWRFTWDSLQDLIDRGLSEEAIEGIRNRLLGTAGVHGIDALRTRKMGDSAVVDVHILVDSRISVSEGHYIAEQARANVMQDPLVLDVLVHVDPESDAQGTGEVALPSHAELLAAVQSLCAAHRLPVSGINPHYLEGAAELDIYLGASARFPSPAVCSAISEALQERFGLRGVRVFARVEGQAPTQVLPG